MFNKILFIGLGGAGQRHLRVIKNILPNAQLTAYRQLYKTPYLNSNFTVNEDLSILPFFKFDKSKICILIDFK